MWQAAEKLKAAGINPRTKEPYKRPCGSYKKLPPEEAAAAAALKAAQVAHKAGEKKAIEKETIATLRGKVATLEAELVLCRARLAPPGPGPRALPGPACHSRAEAPKSAGRGAWRARRGENGPGKPSCPGPSAAHRPARSLTAGPGQEGLPGPFCARRAGEEKTGLAKARSAARERPLLTRPGPAGAPAGPEPAPPGPAPLTSGAPVISGGFLVLPSI